MIIFNMHFLGIIQMRKISIHSYDEFQPLDTVIVGSTYDASFFNGIKNNKVADVFKRIADETMEDIAYFKEQLESHNVNVLSATPKELGYKDNVLDYIDLNGTYEKAPGAQFDCYSGLPVHPLQIRDEFLVMGKKLLVTSGGIEVDGWVRKMKEWFGEEQMDLRLYNDEFEFQPKMTVPRSDIEDYELNWLNRLRGLHVGAEAWCGFCAPDVTRIGKTCIVDLWESDEVLNWLQEYYPYYNYKSLSLGGHLDSIFTVIKPGVLIAGPWFRGNEHLFPGWEINYFEDPNWSKITGWARLKLMNRGAWHVPGEEDNDEFTHFVETVLPHWTGYAEETIFDINCLVIDDRHVVTNSDNPQLLEIFRRHKIEPIICPLRHRFFWDGGWHCMTLDVVRRGGQVDYGI